MAHRGRLSVLAHILGKPLGEIFEKFSSTGRRASRRPSCEDVGHTGDVTYHLGARTAYPTSQTVEMLVTLAPNPSHLEFVDPVVEGMCRAADERRDRARPAVSGRGRVGRRADPRRRGVRRRRDRRRNAEPVAPRRLPHRRHGPHHREQPAWLYHGARRPLDRRSTRATSPRASRFRSSTSTPTIRRRASRRFGLAHAYRQTLPQGLPDRSGRLPPLGPQRGRGADLHPAAVYERVKNHPTVRAIWAEPPDRRRPRSRRPRPSAAATTTWTSLRAAYNASRPRRRRRASARSRCRRSAGRHRRPRFPRAADPAQRSADLHPPELHDQSQSWRAGSSAARRR